MQMVNKQSDIFIGVCLRQMINLI